MCNDGISCHILYNYNEVLQSRFRCQSTRTPPGAPWFKATYFTSRGLALGIDKKSLLLNIHPPWRQCREFYPLSVYKGSLLMTPGRAMPMNILICNRKSTVWAIQPVLYNDLGFLAPVLLASLETEFCLFPDPGGWETRGVAGPAEHMVDCPPRMFFLWCGGPDSVCVGQATTAHVSHFEASSLSVKCKTPIQFSKHSSKFLFILLAPWLY